jgi:regulator of sigma E protease
MSIIVSFLVFSILIFIHELGHFLLAKKSGIRVVEFSIGMGPRIISFVKGETRYSIKLLFFGGSCQMLDEDYFGEEEVDLDHENSFSSKSVWSRIAVIFAGPLFNFLLAFLLAIIVMGKVGYDKPEITYIEKNSPMDKAGIEKGDIITEFDGEDISLSREIMVHLYASPLTDEKIKVKVLRDGKEIEKTITPVWKERYAVGVSYTNDDNPAYINDLTKGGAFMDAGVKKGDKVLKINDTVIKTGNDIYNYFIENPLTKEENTYTLLRDGEEYSITVSAKKSSASYYLGFDYNTYRVKTDGLDTLKYSVSEIKFQIKSVYKSLSLLFSGKLGANDFTGPVGIVDIIDNTYEASKPEGFMAVFLNLANITILLSANLGVMNLLPIPGLDGGRLVFLLIEAIFKKPVPRKFEGVVTAACMILIMLFAVYILFHDISKIF